MTDYRPKCVIRAPVNTASGYGEMSRDIVRHIIEYDKFDVEVHSIMWGVTPMGVLEEDDPMDKMILDRITPEQLTEQPDLYVSISVPTEFQPVGRYNIGITAGIETTQASTQWVDAMNRMDVNFVISEHAKNVFQNSRYQKQGPDGTPLGVLECAKPIEVLHNCVDTDVYKKTPAHELEKTIKEQLSVIDEKFGFLFVGHWMKGDLGQDRKNVGMLISVFCDVFKRKEFPNKPALLLKSSAASYSLLDREEIKKRIELVKGNVPLAEGEELPNVYLIHGNLTDKEMNSLYNHPKVKAHVTFTKGEGFGRPLLEASLSGTPVLAPGWSGHLDFLDKENAILIGGELQKVHPSAAWENVILEEASWMQVDANQAAQAMVEAYQNNKEWRAKGTKLAKKNRKYFNYNTIRENTWTLLDKYVPEFEAPAPKPKMNEIKLPKLKRSKKTPQKIELPKLKKVENDVNADS
jgi:glycosyltransferase involved in cell wall biosynthesis